MNTTLPVTVYYDGLCPLCSREIDYYRRKAPAGALECVDITADSFQPADHGLDRQRVHRYFHARTDGKLLTGLDAFRAIWSVIPGSRWVAWVTGLPIVWHLLVMGYALFAIVRPWLPRRKRPDCPDGSCQI